ncbi:hypothetical protein [Gloeobacter morelensis]|uniref:hypothetical protein n=1 Tax=Gloeobacter morelensis TaxID=2907343 RepID=UPI001E33A8C2|nr:hypothetical protein [Gloeobacter morelensis]UFP97234.1 hypothetical protein ISF26_24235 [Gloeobacter morelensis MG652769]
MSKFMGRLAVVAAAVLLGTAVVDHGQSVQGAEIRKISLHSLRGKVFAVRVAPGTELQIDVSGTGQEVSQATWGDPAVIGAEIIKVKKNGDKSGKDTWVSKGVRIVPLKAKGSTNMTLWLEKERLNFWVSIGYGNPHVVAWEITGRSQADSDILPSILPTAKSKRGEQEIAIRQLRMQMEQLEDKLNGLRTAEDNLKDKNGEINPDGTQKSLPVQEAPDAGLLPAPQLVSDEEISIPMPDGSKRSAGDLDRLQKRIAGGGGELGAKLGVLVKELGQTRDLQSALERAGMDLPQLQKLLASS